MKNAKFVRRPSEAFLICRAPDSESNLELKTTGEPSVKLLEKKSAVL